MTVRIGEQDVGIRTTSRAFGDWLEHTLGRYRIRKEVAPEFSIAVDGGEPDGAGSGRRFHILYQGVGAVMRTMNQRTLGRSILSELESRLLRTREDAVYAHYGLGWADGVSVLMPAWLVAYLAGTGRRLHRSGIELSARRWIAFERGTGSVLPERPVLEVPEDALDLLPDGSAVEPARGVVREPRTVSAIITYDPELETIRGGARAAALYHLASATANLPTLGGEAVRTLGEVVGGAHAFDTGLGRAHQMLQAVTDVVAHERTHEHAGAEA